MHQAGINQTAALCWDLAGGLCFSPWTWHGGFIWTLPRNHPSPALPLWGSHRDGAGWSPLAIVCPDRKVQVKIFEKNFWYFKKKKNSQAVSQTRERWMVPYQITQWSSAST